MNAIHCIFFQNDLRLRAERPFLLEKRNELREKFSIFLVIILSKFYNSCNMKELYVNKGQASHCLDLHNLAWPFFYFN